VTDPSSIHPPALLDLVVDGVPVQVTDLGGSLLGALRDQLGVRSAKDGCSPQGQCGCCTVLVDGAPRVACVTPLRRVAGRAITTVDGLDPERGAAWGEALCATGGSQCGFCTPGIVVRLDALHAKLHPEPGPVPAADATERAAVERALAAHLCRCTGWQTILEGWDAVSETGVTVTATVPGGARRERDLEAAAKRAAIEGRAPQRVAPDVALGHGGFADDLAPADALVAVRSADGTWAVGESLEVARAAAGKVQGRRTTVDPHPPLELPPGEWAATLRTSWVDPAYLETDATWCEPGGTPATSLANGGAFGAKAGDHLAAIARELADEHGRAVRVLWSREDVARFAPKRPPLAAGVRSDGTGVVRVVRTPGIADAIARVAPGLVVEEVELAGPPTSASVRGAGWAEALMLMAAVAPPDAPVEAVGPEGGRARASLADGGLVVEVAAGDPLDEVVLRSYAIGAAHMATSWITSEGIAVDDDGEVHDLTVRSFGVLRAAASPQVHVTIDPTPGPPVNGSDAVFVAVAAAVWRHLGHPTDLPSGGAIS
jgi:aerobic-type carbon monoxide dehydrogenase small subunit (CoxS/CutS family)